MSKTKATTKTATKATAAKSKTTKQPAAKVAKAPAAKKPTKGAKTPDVEPATVVEPTAAPADAQPADECPRGGNHEWTEEDGERFCAKCKEPEAEPVKPAKAKKPKAAKDPKVKRLSAIDAAAQVLAETKEPMNTRQMIEAMTAKGLWTSPGGKTPHATLYSTILREIASKGNDARFTKTERGQFTATTK